MTNIKMSKFIKITPENPVLWTGMKGVSAKGRKKLNQMLKRVQHDNRVGSRFLSSRTCFGICVLGLNHFVLKPRPVGGVLYSLYHVFHMQVKLEGSRRVSFCVQIIIF